MNRLEVGDFIYHTDHSIEVFKVTWIPPSDMDSDRSIVCEDRDGKLYTFDINECVKIRL